MRLGALEQGHRERLREILDATAVFRHEEIEVALELFDAGPSDYEFVGAFSADGDLAGYACYGATPGTDRTYDLYWIAVDPRYQGKGDGSRLLGEVERQLHARDARLLVVETSSREVYAPTRGFYQNHGYTEVARVRDYYDVRDDRVVYVKRMAGRS